MKKLSTIIMALALVLGMSQCKKQETPTTGNSTPGFYITVNVGDQDGKDGKDNNGEKHNIAPQYGLFSFSSGDKLYVGHDGKFVGTLKFKNGFFSGPIYPNDAVTDQPLHFFFLGNSELKSDTVVNQTTSLSINIADQHENLPVLSYGASTMPFTGTGTTYSTTLKNKCALVRFDLQNQGDYEVTLSNVPTLATVNFANPTPENAIVATEGQDYDDITLYGEEGNTAIRWAILLPGTNLTTGHGDLNITYSGDVDLAELAYNDYVNSGISINNPLPLPDAPDAQYAVKTSDGTLTQFSVSANKKVYFSCGNLRYGESHSSKPGWSLHPRQFDEHEDYSGSHHPTSQNPTYDMDRICWGRLPNDGGNYAYPVGGNWIYENDADLSRADNTDWGTVLTTEGNNWRMLTASEWDYLFNATARGTRRFLRVKLGAGDPAVAALEDYGVHSMFNYGILLLPDNYDGAGLSMKDRDGHTYSFNSTGYVYIVLKADGSDDGSKMLHAGAVFLPALGYRDGDQYVINQYLHYTFYELDNGIMYGYYWSSTRLANGGAQAQDRKAKALYFDNTTLNTNYNEFRRRGACVRLVWDAN